MLQRSPSSFFVDLAIDAAASFAPRPLTFASQVAAEVTKKTEPVDNFKKTLDGK